MESFLIDVTMPSMGATVNELTVVTLKAALGARVAKGQKLAELESDKSIFDFESPCDGTVRAILAHPGDVKPSGALFLQLETSDTSLRHLEAKGERPEAGDQTAASSPKPPGSRPLVWTPRAIKLAQEAGVDPGMITGIAATGPGGRVSGDDVASHLAKRKG